MIEQASIVKLNCRILLLAVCTSATDAAAASASRLRRLILAEVIKVFLLSDRCTVIWFRGHPFGRQARICRGGYFGFSGNFGCSERISRPTGHWHAADRQ